MKAEVKEYFDVLLDICKGDMSIQVAYRKLRELLEFLCRSWIEDGYLQMTDLSARISFVAARMGLSVGEQNRLHTLRLTSNKVLNGIEIGTRELLLRDTKTMAFFVRRLTGEDIPKTLYQMLPSADATYVVSPPSVRYIKRMRVCFQYADATYLYVLPVDILSDALVRVRYNVPGVNEEFAETCRLLWRHAQINLLDVSMDEEGILTPFFIILEPDYLIDISSLAECFREFGHHPANYVLSRLRLPENTQHLLLGNIVNLFLDEWIYAEEEVDYMTCMKKAFRMYPLELAACTDLLDPKKESQFFAACKMHFEHIRQTVMETFHIAGYDLDRTEAVLEPSYICEALGLQGRLDYMQRDMCAFIEMKSGRADEYSLRGKIEPKENNRVQMLLYQAVLEYAMGMDHRNVKAYLLYTRYPLLYPARSSWTMMRCVMDVRNRIVEGEYSIQLHNHPVYTAGRFKVLEPETLNERHLNNVLWKRYLAPSIQSLTRKLATLSSLEKSYFYTLYNFITKELYTSKSGDVDGLCRTGACSLWTATLAEKCEAGEILYNLTVIDNHAGDAHKPYICLEYHVADTLLPNFRVGDAVVLYERNTETDNVTNKLVFKGNIEWISSRNVQIRLRASQRNSCVLPMKSRYAIEHDYMDTSFRSMYMGLAAFLSASQRRRDLLLGCRKPEFDSAFNEAIVSATDDFTRIVLKARAAQDFFLLIGPPGTGKTSCALRKMVEAFYNEGKQILLLSYTNRAVDEICKMLVAITPEIDFIRIGSELSCEEAYRPYLIENVLADCSNRRIVQERLSRCRVFVGTVATLSSKTDLFHLKRFEVALVDEATQILEPQLLGLLCIRTPNGTDAIGKFILIGDHKQLPSVVLQSAMHSEVHDDALRKIGMYNLRDSLFERLYHHLSQEEADFKACPAYDMLCRQGRMNEVVAEFPNHAFYHGLLQTLGLPHQQGSLQLAACMEGDPLSEVLKRRVSFLPSEPELATESVKINHSEAGIVARLAEAVYRQYSATEGFDAAHTLGIIAPYRSQIALIRREIASLGIPVLDTIVIDTVERFQGSERDVIIYSFCVNRVYQMKFLSSLTMDRGILIDRKLNVVLTRARKQMFVTGVPGLLRQNPVYAALLQAWE